MVSIVRDVVDCNSFLNSLDIFRFDQIEFYEARQAKKLHKALLEIYTEVQGYNLNSLVLSLDFLLEIGFKPAEIDISLKKPRPQPFFVFDFRTHDADLFFCAYFSIGNKFQPICEKHGMKYSAAKNIWYLKIPLNQHGGVNGAMEIMAPFFNDIKVISRVFLFRSTMQKYYRVA